MLRRLRPSGDSGTMILSHKHKFIFVKTEKTAGTSFEIALSKFCGPEDVITPIAVEDEEIRKKLGYRSPQNFHMSLGIFSRQSKTKILADLIKMYQTKKIPKRFWNHITASEIRESIGSDIWDNYTKFTIIRDPVDQTISNFIWVRNRFPKNDDLHNISAYIRTRPARLRNNWNIISHKGEFILDDVIRYENLHADADFIAKKIGLPEALSKTLSNITSKGQYRYQKKNPDEIVGPDDIRVIRYLRKEEIEFFGY